MKSLFLIALALGLVLLSCVVSAEELLFERSISINRSVNIFDTDEFDLDLTFGDRVFMPTNAATVFDDLMVTPAAVGNSYDLSIGDSEFDFAAQRLTDAENEFIRLVLTENQTSGLVEQRGFSERNFFLGRSTPTSPDLAGANLERVRLSVEDFTLEDNTGSVGAISSGPPVNLELTLSFFGTAVPEPSGIWLLWSGLVTLIGVGKRLRPVPVRLPTDSSRR